MTLEHVQPAKFSVVESWLVLICFPTFGAQGHECERSHDTTEKTCLAIIFFRENPSPGKSTCDIVEKLFRQMTFPAVNNK